MSPSENSPPATDHGRGTRTKNDRIRPVVFFVRDPPAAQADAPGGAVPRPRLWRGGLPVSFGQTKKRTLYSQHPLWDIPLRYATGIRHRNGDCLRAEWKRMHDPDAMKIFPYIRYHARKDSRSRDGHKELDGKNFHKDDPFLKTHTPPWEFNCCWLEEITAKEAGRESEKV